MDIIFEQLLSISAKFSVFLDGNNRMGKFMEGASDATST